MGRLDVDTRASRSRHVTEARFGNASSVVRRRAERYVFFNAHFQMKAELVVDVAREVRPPEAEVPAPRRRTTRVSGHGFQTPAGRGGASSAAKTASAYRDQFVVS